MVTPEAELQGVVIERPEPPEDERPAGRRSSRFRRHRALAEAVLGVVLVLVAGWGIRAVDSTVRVVLALAGLLLVWRGLQTLGRARYGPSFRLGLWVALVWMGIVTLAAVFADVLPIEHWKTADLSRDAFDLAPGLRWPEFLGRTSSGYSELSHVIYGARTSLTIGFVAVAVGLVVGIVIGLFSGWYGKVVDGTVSIGTNTILAFPPLILILAIVAVYGSSVTTLALALAVVSIPTYTRIMRAQTLAVRQREYVQAAEAMGASNARLMWREVLPNAMLPVVSYSFIIVAVVIVAEGSLSYIGVGVPSPQPSWGGMIAAGQRKLKTVPHLVFVPAMVMFLTVLSLNRIGEAVRKRVLTDDQTGSA